MCKYAIGSRFRSAFVRMNKTLLISSSFFVSCCCGQRKTVQVASVCGLIGLPPCANVLQIPVKGLGFFLPSLVSCHRLLSVSHNCRVCVRVYSIDSYLRVDNRIYIYIIESNVIPIRQIYQCFCLHNNSLEFGSIGTERMKETKRTEIYTHKKRMQHSIEKITLRDSAKKNHVERN